MPDLSELSVESTTIEQFQSTDAHTEVDAWLRAQLSQPVSLRLVHDLLAFYQSAGPASLEKARMIWTHVFVSPQAGALTCSGYDLRPLVRMMVSMELRAPLVSIPHVSQLATFASSRCALKQHFLSFATYAWFLYSMF